MAIPNWFLYDLQMEVEWVVRGRFACFLYLFLSVFLCGGGDACDAGGGDVGDAGVGDGGGGGVFVEFTENGLGDETFLVAEDGVVTNGSGTQRAKGVELRRARSKGG